VRWAIALGGLAGAILLGAVIGLPAVAQDSQDASALQDRLQRLDRALADLQRQAYRGGGGTPPPGTLLPPPSDASATAVGGLQSRIQQAQNDLRQTNGQLEEINFAVGDLRQRLDRLVTDLDTRLAALEKAFAQRPPPAAPAATPAAAPGAAAPPAKTAAAPAVKLPKGTPKEQYEFAFDLLKRSEYAQAEQAMKQFVAAHPNDPLASNAQYWLAETFFVRNNFTDAASAFLTTYQKYPKSVKAPDSLLKLGESLAKLNKTKEACAAFARFQSEYPKATGAQRGRAADERQRLKCT